MRVLGIDPGSKTTGWALYDSEERRVLSSGEFPGARWHAMADEADLDKPTQIIIERPKAYGMAGGDVVDTAFVAGHLFGGLEDIGRTSCLLRSEICNELGEAVHQRALKGDAAVRAVLIELHGEGSHKKGGPLAGVKGHAWAALAAAVAFVLREEQEAKT